MQQKVALDLIRVSASIDDSGTSAEGFHDYVFFVVLSGSVRINSRGISNNTAGGDIAFLSGRRSSSRCTASM
ncbi:hypothetical protein [Actinoplanes sp. TFC3]|uniref:hypothetical protein n=1 Tax=Actinoplanes sp. TFC3 TaxID=1710355 RepID=UPI0008342C81|nr:hypothetical protein [Actinoplanes sp. TFC3]